MVNRKDLIEQGYEYDDSGYYIKTVFNKKTKQKTTCFVDNNNLNKSYIGKDRNYFIKNELIYKISKQDKNGWLLSICMQENNVNNTNDLTIKMMEKFIKERGIK